MTSKEKRFCEFYLCGLHAAEFEGDKTEPPSDAMLKNWIIVSPNERVRMLLKGPHGENIRAILNASILRAGQADLERLRQQERERNRIK